MLSFKYLYKESLYYFDFLLVMEWYLNDTLKKAISPNFLKFTFSQVKSDYITAYHCQYLFINVTVPVYFMCNIISSLYLHVANIA